MPLVTVVGNGICQEPSILRAAGSLGLRPATVFCAAAMCAADESSSVVIDVKNGDATRARHAPLCDPFFVAIGGMMRRARQSRLEPEDLMLMHPSDDVEKNAQTLKASWDPLIQEGSTE